jgi:hypothetical protein
MYIVVLITGVFHMVEEFMAKLERECGKKLIITAQTYDGASSMRYQAQGHIRSRLSAWGFYVYCRSHLLNLSVKDAVEYTLCDAYDTAKSALVFLRDSSHRLEILTNSQKTVGSSKNGTKKSDLNCAVSDLSFCKRTPNTQIECDEMVLFVRDRSIRM